MTTDLFASNMDAVGAPYTHALEISSEEIIAGDVELPFVSNCLLWTGSGPLKVTLKGGEIVTFRAPPNGKLEIRAVKIHQAKDYFDSPPAVVALW